VVRRIGAGQQENPPGPCSRSTPGLSVCGRLLSAQSGVGSHQQLVELLLRSWLVTDQRPDNRAHEPQRNTQDPGILQRE